MPLSKKTLDPLTESPTTKVSVTKSFMLAYMKSEKATDEDRTWFKQIVSDPKYQEQKINKFNGGTYVDVKLPEIRDLFCERFYPNLITKKNSYKSFIESVMEL